MNDEIYLTDYTTGVLVWLSGWLLILSLIQSENAGLRIPGVGSLQEDPVRVDLPILARQFPDFELPREVMQAFVQSLAEVAARPEIITDEIGDPLDDTIPDGNVSSTHNTRLPPNNQPAESSTRILIETPSDPGNSNSQPVTPGGTAPGSPAGTANSLPGGTPSALPSSLPATPIHSVPGGVATARPSGLGAPLINDPSRPRSDWFDDPTSGGNNPSVPPLLGENSRLSNFLRDRVGLAVAEGPEYISLYEIADQMGTQYVERATLIRQLAPLINALLKLDASFTPSTSVQRRQIDTGANRYIDIGGSVRTNEGEGLQIIIIIIIYHYF